MNDRVKEETLNKTNQNVEAEGVAAPKDKNSGTYSQDEFKALPTESLEKLTGLTPPEDSEELDDYREKAWQSYKLDLENKAQWGTARQGRSNLPEGV